MSKENISQRTTAPLYNSWLDRGRFEEIEEDNGEVNMAQILGGITGVFLFSWLINLIVSKLRHSDTPRQRIIIITFVAILSIIINTKNLQSIQAPQNEILVGVVIYSIGWLIALYFFGLKGKALFFKRNK